MDYKNARISQSPEQSPYCYIKYNGSMGTKVDLLTNNTSIEVNTINYITGILQGDYLSLMLFILSVNPLSFLLSLLPGYNITKTNNNKHKLTHLFFVDDLKNICKK